ncbi:MAG: polysaccharide deacetylase family protein [Deltaproteobacteria bacterium]|nr:polysaccharide deacetylase family protein [Deltaproteobacteria bacterium]
MLMRRLGAISRRMNKEDARMLLFLSEVGKAAKRMLAWTLLASKALTLCNRLVNRFQGCVDTAGKMTFPFVQKRKSHNLQILTYHRVNAEGDPFFPALAPAVFERHMEYLASHFHVLPLVEAVTRLQTDDVPDNAVVVTFDDGYQDNYQYAFPILQQMAIPATIFLSTAVIGAKTVLWHDRVFSAFRETNASVLKGYESNTVVYPLRTLAEKLAAQRAVLQFLRLLDDFEREQWIQVLTSALAVNDKKEEPGLMLSWEEVQTMSRAGIDFGSHTISHPILAKLPAKKVLEEIRESRTEIEQRLGKRVQTFAYPNGGRGDFDEFTKQVVREAGYLCAVTTVFGTNAAGSDPFELRRGGPWEEHLPTFAMKLNWYKFASLSP